MPPKKPTDADQASSGQQQQTARAEEENEHATLLRDNKLSEAVEASVEAACKTAEERSARLLADATETAAKVTNDAKEAVDRVMNRAMKEATEATAKVTNDAKEAADRVMKEATEAAAKLIADEFEESRKEREALVQEKAWMEKAHTFQKNKIILNVGGQRFETSRQTLTSVPDTYLASMFSGRFELEPDVDDGSYFIDRDPRHFNLVLNHLRHCGSSTASAVASTMDEQQRKELEDELAFYGLLDRMLPPHHKQDQIGRDLLRRACSGTGTKRDIQTAVAQARALVFTIGSTTPFLSEEFQDLRFVITDRVVNGSPVWAAVDGKRVMFRDGSDGFMMIGEAYDFSRGQMYNDENSEHVLAPTELLSDNWFSLSVATLEAQYASTKLPPSHWARVPEMRITVVHGLNDDDPAMAAALRTLASLP